MTAFLNLPLWAMVLTLLSVGVAPRATAQNLDPEEPALTLDKGWDITPAEPPKESKSSPDQNLSVWDIPSQNKYGHGIRYGTMIYRQEGLKADLNLGITKYWLISQDWDFSLSGDLIYPQATNIEFQFVRTFSRSLLKPSAHIGMALEPNPKNGLAFLLDPESSYLTYGLAMQDEWRPGGALKLELSGMASFGGEPKVRFLIYILQVY